MALTDIEGVGAATAERLLAAFGDEATVLKAARDHRVDRLAAVEGVGDRRAVEIVLRVLGREPTDFLRTPRARQLHRSILAEIEGFACTDRGRNRARLLVPLTDRARIQENLAFARRAREAVAVLDRERVTSLLRRVHPLREPRPHYDGGLAILVDVDEDHERLVEHRVDRHAPILTPQDAAFNDQGLIVYAYSRGRLDLEGADNVVPVPFTTEVHRLVPEATLHRFRENRGLLEAASELTGILADAGAVAVSGNPAADALRTLDEVGGTDRSFDEVEVAVREAVDAMNEEVREGLQTLELRGDDVVKLLSGDEPRPVRDLQAAVLARHREALLERLGEDLGGVFQGTYPLEVDERALEDKRHALVGRWRRRAFQGKADAASDLARLEPAIVAQLDALLSFDFDFAVGSFVLHHDLHEATFGEGLQVEGALHLDIPPGEGQPVDYHVGTAEDAAAGERDAVVLLTGANSGGKTTLLETLAQATILAHMGLPVNARRATVEPVEALYFFTQKRSLDAGAFETFLRDFVPIVTSPTRKLVLADELEAMTELEAAARILGTFIEMLRETGSLGVVVTHMAEQVGAFTSVRVDGIEARGLDESNELLVDRTPRIGYRARSTPELILQRLAKRTEGAEREVYERILETFRDDAN